MRSTKLAALGFVAAALLLPLGMQAALAQINEPVPSYAQPNNEQTIRGRVSAINGTYRITVDDDNGYVDSVQLHQGTIINPTGLTLAVGMNVTITGYNAGSVFEANQIDTPYTYGGPPAPRAYYGGWYPYAYGYGPAFGLYFGTGFVYRGYYPYRPYYSPYPYWYRGAYNSRPYGAPPYRAPFRAPGNYRYGGHPYVGHPYVAHPYGNHPHRG
jgi:hypothetical protein